jgi:phosphatidate phosphatase PAH1
MKVGEAGEAFFVVETENEVPEELQTSPVISAADVSGQRCQASKATADLTDIIDAFRTRSYHHNLATPTLSTAMLRN